MVGRVGSTPADGAFGCFVIEAATASRAAAGVLRAAPARTPLRSRRVACRDPAGVKSYGRLRSRLSRALFEALAATQSVRGG